MKLAQRFVFQTISCLGLNAYRTNNVDCVLFISLIVVFSIICLTYVQEGLETLIKRGVLTSKDDALHLLDVIQRETALRFSNLAIAIQAGAYDAVSWFAHGNIEINKWIKKQLYYFICSF